MYNQQQQQNNQGIFPKFVIRPVENKGKSAKEGRPIFEDREFVEIVIAGDSKTKVSKRVTDEHRQRWPAEYEAFKRGQEAPLEGTPITEWGTLPASKAAGLKALNILTVEALAQLPDTGINRLGMGARDLVNKAKAFLESSKDSGLAEKLAVENETLKNDIAMLQEQIKELSARMDSSDKEENTTKEVKRGPGRPSKN